MIWIRGRRSRAGMEIYFFASPSAGIPVQLFKPMYDLLLRIVLKNKIDWKKSKSILYWWKKKFSLFILLNSTLFHLGLCTCGCFAYGNHNKMNWWGRNSSNLAAALSLSALAAGLFLHTSSLANVVALKFKHAHNPLHPHLHLCKRRRRIKNKIFIISV